MCSRQTGCSQTLRSTRSNLPGFHRRNTWISSLRHFTNAFQYFLFYNWLFPKKLMAFNCFHSCQWEILQQLDLKFDCSCLRIYMHTHLYPNYHTHTHKNYICLCLPLDRTRHKVKWPVIRIIVGVRERKVGPEPRLEPCWSMQVIITHTHTHTHTHARTHARTHLHTHERQYGFKYSILRGKNGNISQEEPNFIAINIKRLTFFCYYEN